MNDHLAQIPPASSGEPGFERILIATDGTPISHHALGWTRELALTRSGGRVWLVHVLPVGKPSMTPHGEDALQAARRELDGTEVQDLFGYGDPTKEIVNLSTGVKADLVVLGSHSRGPVGRLLLGSVSSGVKDHVEADVLIARSPPRPTSILVVEEDSQAGRRALSIGHALSRSWNAHVASIHPGPKRSSESVERVLKRSSAIKAGLLIIPSQRHDRPTRRDRASLGDALAQQAHTSVLLVR